MLHLHPSHVHVNVIFFFFLASSIRANQRARNLSINTSCYLYISHCYIYNCYVTVDFRGYWIGAYAVYSPWSNRTWYWYNGQRVSYQPWKPGQPDNSFLQQMNVQAGNRGWDDENDMAKGYFLCEINLWSLLNEFSMSEYWIISISLLNTNRKDYNIGN